MFDKESRLREHVLIDEYGSEEIPDLFGHRTQMQESIAHFRIKCIKIGSVTTKM